MLHFQSGVGFGLYRNVHPLGSTKPHSTSKKVVLYARGGAVESYKFCMKLCVQCPVYRGRGSPMQHPIPEGFYRAPYIFHLFKSNLCCLGCAFKGGGDEVPGPTHPECVSGLGQKMPDKKGARDVFQNRLLSYTNSWWFLSAVEFLHWLKRSIC